MNVDKLCEDLADYYRAETLKEDFEKETLQLFVDWYTEFLKGDYQPTTIDTDLSNVKMWIEYCEERGVDITEASEGEIKRYIRRIHGTKSDSAVSNTATAIRKWHDWLEETERRNGDPTAEIVPAEMFNNYDPDYSQRQEILDERTAPDEITTISPEDVDVLAEHCGAPRTRNELLIRLMFQTCMRPLEAANAKIDNIHWDNRSIHIRTAKAEPKHPYRTRFVFWHRDLDALMYRWLGGPDGEGGERDAYLHHDESPYIFLTRKKPQMRSGYVSRIVREAAERAGIQEELAPTEKQVHQAPDQDIPLYKISGHELRRAGITHYANHVDELDLHQIQAIAGHKDIKMTRKYVDDDWSEIKSTMRTVTF